MISTFNPAKCGRYCNPTGEESDQDIRALALLVPMDPGYLPLPKECLVLVSFTDEVSCPKWVPLADVRL